MDLTATDTAAAIEADVSPLVLQTVLDNALDVAHAQMVEACDPGGCFYVAVPFPGGKAFADYRGAAVGGEVEAGFTLDTGYSRAAIDFGYGFVDCPRVAQ